MELINRYLNAVKFWLPKAQQDDIIAELSEDIRSQIEDKEGELGRKLNETEVAAILRRLGRPVFVANRYLPQQQLIGPVLFPIYRFVLKIVILSCLAPLILVWMALISFNPVYRASHSGEQWLGALASFWGSFWLTAMISAGVVTLIFAAIERKQASTRFLEDWDPRALPTVRDPHQIPRSASIGELVGVIVCFAWFAGALGFQTVFEFSGTKIVLAPVWRDFMGGFLILLLANIAVSGWNLFRPRWTPLRAGLRLLTDCTGGGLFCWLLKSSVLAEIIVPNVSQAKTMEVTNAINLWMSRSFPFAVIVCVIILLVDIRRIFRVKTTIPKLTRCAVACLLLGLIPIGAGAQTAAKTPTSPCVLPAQLDGTK